MIHQYLVIHVSFVFYVLIKVFCKVFEKHRSLMHDKPLKSIAECNENEKEIVKWVPKRKHEVLKAKYKCLKKLFQIYDASVIGILPETVFEDSLPLPDEGSKKWKVSCRTKTDAAADTSEFSSGDVTQSENDVTIASALIKELKINVSTSIEEKAKSEIKDDKFTQESRENVSIMIDKKCETKQPTLYQLQNQRNCKRKPTRFQAFLHRLLGLNNESQDNIEGDDKVYAASDNNISNIYEKRRQRGLRLRRIKRFKKTHSEIVLGHTQSPMILSHVQTIHNSYLLDRTQRQCPIPGCNMTFNGIINYNDHLNLCHFPEKKFICNYCHDGFYTIHEKIVHENEHLGLIKLSSNTPIPPTSAESRAPTKVTNTNDTQTEADKNIEKINVPDDKLKKIVSFFDKIEDPDEIIAEIKRNQLSESSIKAKEVPTKELSETFSSKNATKCTSSFHSSNVPQGTYSLWGFPKDVRRVEIKHNTSNKCSSIESSRTSRTHCRSFRCRICGENFNYRSQLKLHMDKQHGFQNRFPKFHSCAGILNFTSESENKRLSTVPSSADSEYSKVEKVRCEPSANIIYYTSTETVNKKSSIIDNMVHKVRTGFSYRWEPGTKIIRV